MSKTTLMRGTATWTNDKLCCLSERLQFGGGMGKGQKDKDPIQDRVTNYY